MKNLIQRFIREEDGQDIIEYALLAAFISIVAATVINTIGTDILNIYSAVKVQTGTAAS
jgi:Flp pilus assembly pilin Flp